MLIELKNKTTISTEKIISIKNAENIWTIKLSNMYEIPLFEGEYEWLMTNVGNIIEIRPDLAVNMHAIVMLEPNQNGYLIGWEGEPPIEITSEKATLLITFLSEHKHHMILEDRIQFLVSKDVSPNYNKL